jgi:hypothetical protein
MSAADSRAAQRRGDEGDVGARPREHRPADDVGRYSRRAAAW